MTIPEILELLAQRQPLNDEQADFMFTKLMGGNLTEGQTGALLMGLRAKGEDSTDLAAGVRAVVSHAKKIPGFDGSRSEPVVDTCGTGGDGQCSFNNSTAVSLFLADMGYTIAKHGNRALSSSCGSADALEALGIPLEQTPEEAADGLAKFNFAFLFAPAYHPAFKFVMPVRQQLGIRTLFNFMGPLTNPARPSHQLIGVGAPDKLELMGETLLLTGVKRALIFSGAGGFDELTTWGVNRGYLIHDGIMEKTSVNPEQLGFPQARSKGCGGLRQGRRRGQTEGNPGRERPQGNDGHGGPQSGRVPQSSGPGLHERMRRHGPRRGKHRTYQRNSVCWINSEKRNNSK